MGLSEMAQLFGENLDAVHEVRVFNLQEAQKRKFEGLNGMFKQFSLKMAKYELMQQPFMEFLAATMVSMTFVYAYFAGIDFPTFSAIGIALYFTIDPIKRVIRMSTDFIKVMPLVDRICAILDYVSTVPEPENPVELPRVRGEITFDNVKFAYKDKTVLDGVSITIPAGTSCALVGESGAGKSTFAKLAMRLYDPIEGSVKLDGIDLRDMRQRDFMDNLGSVPQYPVLFNDTVYNNILVARPGAAKEEVEAAAKMAYAHDFILELENGYGTVVGERGDRLSGGQKQRIALARVFLKTPAARARRSHVRARRKQRGVHTKGRRQPHEGPHDARHRPQVQHHKERAENHSVRKRQNRRFRLARRAHGALPDIPQALRKTGGAHSLRIASARRRAIIISI